MAANAAKQLIGKGVALARSSLRIGKRRRKMSVTRKCPRCGSQGSINYSIRRCSFFCGKCDSSWKMPVFFFLGWIVFRIALGVVVGFALGLRGVFLVLGIYIIAIPLDAAFETLVCYFSWKLRRADVAKCPSCGARLLTEDQCDGRPFECESCGIGLLATTEQLEQETLRRKFLAILGVILFVSMVTIQQPVLRSGIAFLFLFLLNDVWKVLAISRTTVLERAVHEKETL
jgi:hypothetical protein